MTHSLVGSVLHEADIYWDLASLLFTHALMFNLNISIQSSVGLQAVKKKLSRLQEIFAYIQC